MSLNRLGYQLQSQTTPSSGISINDLPPELLSFIFVLYSSFDNGPIRLLLVCHLWYEVVTDNPALWGYLRCNPPADMVTITNFEGSCPVFTNWEGMLKVAERSGNSALSIFFRGNFPHESLPSEAHKVFTRCKRLYIHYDAYPSYFYLNPPKMPALEELGLSINETVNISNLFYSFKVGSPLLYSLNLSKEAFNLLVVIPPFLERIRRLALGRSVSSRSYPHLFKDLARLESLSIAGPFYMRSVPTLPHLISLTINQAIVGTSEGLQVELPALECLSLIGLWGNIQFLAAPRLEYLTLLTGSKEPDPYMSSFRETAMRPTSLIISNDISERNISELLREIWSDLWYLHWKSPKNGNSGPTAACPALAGDDAHPPTCTQLRQFTVDIDVDESSNDVGPLVESMRNVVEERRRQGLGSLERVKCVWGIQANSTGLGIKHLEWVDIL